MDFLPKALGTRPRLAVEVRAEGVVAARAEDTAGLLAAVARNGVAEGSLVPGLKAGNVVDRSALITAVRSVLDAVAATGGGRTRDVTVIVPDAAVRVLLLDFDALPGKVVEALPVVRFRLKKLLPFEVEDAVVSYQVMSSTKGLVTVLAVAIPREVLAEYEGVVTSAGYVPGAVLPSTLAALAALGVQSGPGEVTSRAALVVNAGEGQVTTAIVRDGVLLLHRALELEPEMGGGPEETLPVGTGYAPIDAEEVLQAEMSSEARPPSFGREVAQAVSVAAAYFEDSLQRSPEQLLASGTTGAESLQSMLHANGLLELRVREMMEPGMLDAGAATVRVPRGWLAGVKGALTN